MPRDHDAEEFAAMWQSHKKGKAGMNGHANAHIEARRQKEARAMSPVTRRRARKAETKTTQINIRVTPSFRKRMAALAAARGVTLVELIETAIEAMEGVEA